MGKTLEIYIFKRTKNQIVCKNKINFLLFSLIKKKEKKGKIL